MLAACVIVVSPENYATRVDQRAKRVIARIYRRSAHGADSRFPDIYQCIGTLLTLDQDYLGGRFDWVRI
jgi:hypothetical protein